MLRDIHLHHPARGNETGSPRLPPPARESPQRPFKGALPDSGRQDHHLCAFALSSPFPSRDFHGILSGCLRVLYA
jgi:hypothetical protein